MKHYTFLSMLILLLSFDSRSQTFSKIIQKDGSNEFAYSVVQTRDNGFAIAGSTDERGKTDFFIVRTDSKGDTIWTRRWGVVNKSDYLQYINITSDGGFIAVGKQLSYIEGNQDDVYICKLDSLGKTIWTKQLGGKGNEIGYYIEETLDKGFIISGNNRFKNDFQEQVNETFIIKVNKDGAREWIKTFPEFQKSWDGQVRELKDGSLIFSGSFTQSTGGDRDFFLIKLDSKGNLIWKNSYGDEKDNTPLSVAQTSDKGFILVGYKGDGLVSYNIYMVKVDEKGNLMWKKAFGLGGKDKANCVIPTKDGNFIITGETGGNEYNAILGKFDLTGKNLWVVQLENSKNSPKGNCVIETTDGNLVVVGDIMNPRYWDMFICKRNKDGDKIE